MGTYKLQSQTCMMPFIIFQEPNSTDNSTISDSTSNLDGVGNTTILPNQSTQLPSNKPTDKPADTPPANPSTPTANSSAVMLIKAHSAISSIIVESTSNTNIYYTLFLRISRVGANIGFDEQ